jgi:hypothetical protein
LQNQLIIDFETNETYKTAKEKGLESALMKCAEAQLFIKSQAIINDRFPTYNSNGDKVSQPFAYSNDIAPHINEPHKIFNFAKELYDAKEILLTNEIKQAIVKKWGFMKPKE